MRRVFAKIARRRKGLSGRFRADERGVTLIEVALVLPVLAMLFIGLVEFGEAFTVTRKLFTAASTVSDLVAQEPSVDDDQLDDVLLVADEIIKPYSAAPMSLIIVSVVADAENTTTVVWSYPATYAEGASYDLPNDGLTEPGSSLIVVEASYDFTPSIGNYLGSFTISERAFFRPRLSATVMKTE